MECCICRCRSALMAALSLCAACPMCMRMTCGLLLRARGGGGDGGADSGKEGAGEERTPWDEHSGRLYSLGF